MARRKSQASVATGEPVDAAGDAAGLASAPAAIEKIEKLDGKKPTPKGGKRPGSGRKTGVPNKNKRAVKDMIEPHIEELIRQLLSLAKGAESEAVRVSAAKELFERCLGKVPQAVTGEDGGAITVKFTQ